MRKLTKKKKTLNENFRRGKVYDFDRAVEILRKFSSASFVESVDVAVNLSINPKNPNECIRGCVVLPHGRGKNTKIAVLTDEDTAKQCRAWGADIAGKDDLLDRIASGRIEFDVLVTSPPHVGLLRRIGSILGPKKLMPNKHFGTLTTELKQTIQNLKKGQIHYTNDKNGIVHASVGKIDFRRTRLKENLESLLSAIVEQTPQKKSTILLKKTTLSTTMGAGIEIDPGTLRTSRSEKPSK